MVRCYLAARFSRQHELAGYAAGLRELGIETTSRWLTGVHDWTGTPDHLIPIPDQGRFAQDDLDDIDRADVLVFFGGEPFEYGARGGACVEMGYALGIGMPVVVVGPVQNVFCALPDVIRCETWVEAVAVLTRWLEREAA